MTLPMPAWKASWTQAVTDIRGGSSTVQDVTLRLTIPLALGGERARLLLSNCYGTEPVAIGEAAVVTDNASVQVTFGGQRGALIAPGDDLVSDPIVVTLTAGGELNADIYLPEATALSTGNLTGGPWSISDSGNYAGDVHWVAPPVPPAVAPNGQEYPVPRPLLRGVEVASGSARAVVACLGDSITAGGWPERASILLRGTDIAVLNRGIAGNRLRRDGDGFAGAFFGRSGLRRFDDDVLGTTGVSHAIFALGTNDLGHPGTPAAPDDVVPSTSDLIHALETLVRRSREANITPILATITPFMPAPGYDAEREAIRVAVNEWIRSADRGVLVADFDRAVRSPDNEESLRTDYDSGDHLHPSSLGLDRLARAAADVLEQIHL